MSTAARFPISFDTVTKQLTASGVCRNGSLITIFRNCFLPGGSLKGCQGESDTDSAGVGGKRFFYSISNDGKHQTAPS